MAKHGGTRPGAGRKKGSSNKLKITDLMSIKEIRSVGRAMLNKANEGDVQAQKYIMDQAMGRAPESVDVTSGNEPLTFTIREGGGDQPVESSQEPEETSGGFEQE